MFQYRRFLSKLLIFNFIFFINSTVFAQTQKLETRGGSNSSFRTNQPNNVGNQVVFQGSNQVQIPGGSGQDNNISSGDFSTLGISSYQVHVLGEVGNPGIIQVPPSTRLSNAVKMAGDVQNTGSLRHIQLKRNGKVTNVDLMAYELKGSLENNPYLMENDVIFVPLKKDIVQVEGTVKRNGVYELNGEKTLLGIINLAGGFSAGVDANSTIRVIRFTGEKKQLLEIPVDESAMKSFQIKSGDIIVSPNVITANNKFDYEVEVLPGDKPFYPSYEDRVFVLGGVKIPGAYPFSPHYRVSQYLSLAGGLSDRGKSKKIRVISPDGKSRRVKDVDIVNPGDTIAVRESWLTPIGWTTFVVSLASFGLSAASTVIVLKNK